MTAWCLIAGFVLMFLVSQIMAIHYHVRGMNLANANEKNGFGFEGNLSNPAFQRMLNSVDPEVVASRNRLFIWLAVSGFALVGIFICASNALNIKTIF